MQCTDRNKGQGHKEDLIDLVVKFIEFVDSLLAEGKITPVQYEDLTRQKIEFLKHCNTECRNMCKNYF
ncbi:hypothetical protein [Anaerosolibacter sp.]|uniref:hypothetical protein n=1 Tax=Anaerosolibacter sp. TaxID=1872527 RepID=UPI0039F098C8